MPMDLFWNETGKIGKGEEPFTRKSYPSRSSLFIDIKRFILFTPFRYINRSLLVNVCSLNHLDQYINKSFVHSKFVCLFF